VSRKKAPILLATSWTLLMSTSCLLPASAFSAFSFSTIISIDKVVHLIIYAGFFVLWALALDYHKKIDLYKLLAVSIAFGIIIEILQVKMSLGRQYEFDDILANAVGSVLGLYLMPFIRRKLPLLKKYLPFLNKVY
jgi:glycopeptide antibiotics resistance protein